MIFSWRSLTHKLIPVPFRGWDSVLEVQVIVLPNPEKGRKVEMLTRLFKRKKVQDLGQFKLELVRLRRCEGCPFDRIVAFFSLIFDWQERVEGKNLRKALGLILQSPLNFAPAKRPTDQTIGLNPVFNYRNSRPVSHWKKETSPYDRQLGTMRDTSYECLKEQVDMFIAFSVDRIAWAIGKDAKR